MSAPAVSVALCTHNGARFIVEQLQSILDQTLVPQQVVVSDDASRDDTVSLVESFREVMQAASIELIVLRNEVPLRVTANFEQATLACTGEYIALADQDDVWHPDRLRLLAERLTAKPGVDLVFSDARLVDAQGGDLGHSLFESLEISASTLALIRSGSAFDVLLRRNLVTGATVMFRRSLLTRAVPFDAAWVHDEWLAILAASGNAIDYLPERLIDYRQHGGNEIGVKVPTLRSKVARVLEPRGDRYTDLLLRAENLQRRLQALDAPAPIQQLVTAKVDHQRVRAGLPRVRLARLPAIAREAIAGRYRGFSSQGDLDIVRDLLQPDR